MALLGVFTKIGGEAMFTLPLVDLITVTLTA